MTSADSSVLWRRRGWTLRLEGVRCGACGRFSAVRRLVCAGCGARGALQPARLEGAGIVEAATRVHRGHDQLDQRSAAGAAVIVRTVGGRWACLLADADAPDWQALRGQAVEPVVRRLDREAPTDALVAYVCKARAARAPRASAAGGLPAPSPPGPNPPEGDPP